MAWTACWTATWRRSLGEAKPVDTFPGRLALQQRVLPLYRAAFFDALAAACPDGLSVFAGQPRSDEAIETAVDLNVARLERGRNLHLFSGPLYLCAQPGLLAWLESWQPAALIVEANPRYLSTPRALRWMRARRRPVIGWGLGAPLPTGPLAGARMDTRRRFLAQFDALITYSQRGAEQYHAAGFPAGRVFVARNAAAPRPRRSDPPDRPPAFTTRPVLLFVGRLQARKRIDTLLQACAALPENLQPDVWIVGDGPARAEFETLARAVYPRAQFFGARHGPDLEPLFAAADLFVLPGTGGLAVQQAMAFGLPVIVGEADGTQADLVRPENGWNIPPGDASALTGLLAGVLTDPTRLRQMGAASFRIVAVEVNLEAMVSVFLQALDSVLS